MRDFVSPSASSSHMLLIRGVWVENEHSGIKDNRKTMRKNSKAITIAMASGAAQWCLSSAVQSSHLLYNREQQGLLEVCWYRKYPNFMKCFESASE